MIDKLILFLMISGLSLIAGCSETTSWPKNEFKREQWLQAAEEERYPWVRNIVESGMLKGLSKSQVIELLGTPSGEYDQNITYVVKFGGTGFDQVFILDIRFKEDGKSVSEYLIRGD